MGDVARCPSLKTLIAKIGKDVALILKKIIPTVSLAIYVSIIGGLKMNKEEYHIAKLEVQHILGTRHFVIFGRKTNEICGDNSSAKTSTINSIRWTLGGGRKKVAEQALNKDAVTGKAEIVLDKVCNGETIELNAITITKTIDADGETTLVANRKDGTIVKQTELNSMLSEFTFDPTLFGKLPFQKQEPILAALAGKDFCEKLAEINKKLEKATEQRLFHGQKAREKGELAEVEEAKKIDTVALTKRLAEANSFNEKVEKHTREERKLADKIEAKFAKIDEMKKVLAAEIKETETLQAEFKKWPKPQPKKDVSKITEEIANIGAQNEKYTAYQNYLAELKARDKLDDEYTASQALVADLQHQRREHAKTAKLPVDGLTWGPDGLRQNGKAWSDLSKSERLIASTRIIAAFNPSLKIMTIHESESLDDKNFFALLEEMIKQGYQAWIEKVGKARTKEAIYMKGGGIDEKFATWLKNKKIAWNKKTRLDKVKVSKTGGAKAKQKKSEDYF
jgi:hypothetical protein